MSIHGQGTLWHRNIAENFNRLNRVHERYRQTTDRRTADDIDAVGDRIRASYSFVYIYTWIYYAVVAQKFIEVISGESA